MIRILCASLILMVLSTQFVIGQTTNSKCTSRDQMISILTGKYGEMLKSTGLVSSDRMFELWANESTGTWTALETFASGMSCIRGSGEGYTYFGDILPEPEGEKS